MEITEVWGKNTAILMKYIDGNGVPVIILDNQAAVVYCNQLFLALIKETVIPVGRPIADFLSPQTRTGFNLEFDGDYKQDFWMLEGKGTFYRSLCHIYRGEKQFVVFIDKTLLTDDSFLKKFDIINRELSSLMREIQKKNAALLSVNKELETKEITLRQAAKIANMGHWIWNLTSNKILLSENFYHIWGLEADEVIDTWRPFFKMVHPDDREMIGKVFAETLRNPKDYDGEFRIYHQDGSEHHCRIIGQVDWKGNGTPMRMLGVIQDITEHKLYEQKIKKLAFYDTLTGLPNRRMFQDRLSLALANGKRYGENVAVIFIDLDGFKKVNDRMGHEAGDVVLQYIGAQLKICIRDCDTAARMGGDEFMIILLKCNLMQDAVAIAERILVACRTPIPIKNQLATVGASIGISFFPNDADTIEGLIKKADDAMYLSKQSGGNRITVCQS